MVDGKRIHRLVGYESDGTTRSHAEALIEKLRRDARENRLLLPKGRKTAMRIGEAAKAYLARLEIEGSKDIKAKRRRIELHLKPFFGAMPLPTISTADIERYKQTRLDEIAVRGGSKVKSKDQSKLGKTKPGTINRELAALSHLLHKAVEWGWIAAVPVKIRLLKDEARRIDYLTVEECQRLLSCAEADDNPQIYPFVRIACGPACRPHGKEVRLASAHIRKLRRVHVGRSKHQFPCCGFPI